MRITLEISLTHFGYTLMKVRVSLQISLAKHSYPALAFVFKVSPSAKGYYEEAENKGQRYTKIAVTIMLTIFLPGFALLSICSFSYNILKGNFDTSQWFYMFEFE